MLWVDAIEPRERATPAATLRGADLRFEQALTHFLRADAAGRAMQDIVEQSAATAGNLRQQADRLAEAVGVFRLEAQAG